MIRAIVAADLNWGIGAKGDLLVHIPEDLKRFRRLTKGHTIVMGRLTYESLPVRPLKYRKNVVISRAYDEMTELDDNLFGTDLEHLLSYLEENACKEPEDIFIIGGGQIYKELLPWCDEVLLTRLNTVFPEAEIFFPNLDETGEWEIVKESEIFTFNDLEYQFVDYRRISKHCESD